MVQRPPSHHSRPGCKLCITLLFNGHDMLSFASDKSKLFAENFSKNSNLDDSGICLHSFPSITNLNSFWAYISRGLLDKPLPTQQVVLERL